MLRNHLSHAWRYIIRHPIYSLINVSGLTLGLCACVIIYQVVRYEFSFDSWHPGKERIYRVTGELQMKKAFPGKIPLNNIPIPAVAVIRQEIPGLEAVAPFRSDGEKIIFTDPAWFTVFSYEWLAGSPASALESPFSVVLSESSGRRHFGGLSPDKMIGKQLVYDDSVKVRVTGIVKDWDRNTDFPFTDFISFATIHSPYLNNKLHPDEWGPAGSLTGCFVKLSKTNARADLVNRQLAALVRKNMGNDSIYRIEMQLQPIADIHFNAAYIHRDGEPRKANRPTLYGLMEIAVFILLLAIVNFISLSTAQAIGRMKDAAVRKILGSSKTGLIKQFLRETLLLTFLAGSFALLLLPSLLRFFRPWLPPGMNYPFFEGNTFLFLLAMILLTSALAGLYPAREIASAAPLLNKRSSGGIRQWGHRKGMIVFQFTISLVFIIGTIVINRQIRFMRTKDLGFSPDHIISIPTNRTAGPDSGRLALLARRIRQIRGVSALSLQSVAPQSVGDGMLVDLEYKGRKSQTIYTEMRAATADYINLYRIRLLAGRNLLPGDSLRELIINETLSKTLGFTRPEQALGQFLYTHGKALPIVGVVADFNTTSLLKGIGPLCIGHKGEEEKGLGVRLSSTGPETQTILSGIEKVWKELYPKTPFTYQFYEETIAGFYQQQQQAAQLAGVATGLAIFISCLGLLGLAMFTAERRAREISIRKVLGATIVQILGLLGKDFCWPILLALVLAIPIAWIGMNHWLQDFAYRIHIGGWEIGLAGSSTLGVAAFTIGFHSVRAAITSPLNHLRQE